MIVQLKSRATTFLEHYDAQCPDSMCNGRVPVVGGILVRWTSTRDERGNTRRCPRRLDGNKSDQSDDVCVPAGLALRAVWMRLA
jgi:hypothetical protein